MVVVVALIRDPAYLRDHIRRLAEVGASARIRLSQKVFNQSHSDIVSHLIQLLIDLMVVPIVVLTELCDECAICESH